ncbi:hypothetical protein NE237_006692 [Protea cynaroides]|uniref:Uncharacterized protein n=1 Tax=Protea cynaroides TaxID=273540 RepID=A0A9Q0KMR8_9MAGN|nr:hypothetical protein NE237_006692 [Protea cynaroides]
MSLKHKHFLRHDGRQSVVAGFSLMPKMMPPVIRIPNLGLLAETRDSDLIFSAVACKIAGDANNQPSSSMIFNSHDAMVLIPGDKHGATENNGGKTMKCPFKRSRWLVKDKRKTTDLKTQHLECNPSMTTYGISTGLPPVASVPMPPVSSVPVSPASSSPVPPESAVAV